ncbi:electron transfer flavoprotein alpha subunit apoprotein [Desulfacinum hydrothermale DSM 13146]|uniref:Electron transfer flavoprotein alpha subunit apoprotein n=1 Tax=Desulfacinum hydrothermale DSM 13146 TaxID=1121390 RepID=A0A1W1X2X3_9BACT|nr:electron transfer flavoprotein subunit alpha/FixB family protein [Desulfacinum hydrothermale]SMC18306.1 electron transfer flavoprotein alpha subunit apoprotein [Desulfacinum hydrothermale DSM 13146]
MTRRVLIYLDPEGEADSIQLLEAANRMYGATGYRSYGLRLAGTCPQAEGLLDVLLQVEDPRVRPYDAANLARCVEAAHRKHHFDAILIPATTFGRMIAPRAAMRLHVGLTADVADIHREKGRIELVRAAFGGRMRAVVAHRGRGPLMITVRKNTFTLDARIRRSTDIAPLVVDGITEPEVTLVERRPAEKAADIRESEVLVSGGGGIKEHFDQLEKLARALGGRVSASRRVVDAGLAPRRIQVGQSGKTVSPRLYIAVGISGSIQHVMGLKEVDTIIVANTDRNAPLCSLADMVVEGDGMEFVDRLTKRLLKGGKG